MQRRLTAALAEGASGFSNVLYYPPNMMAPIDEVIAVAEALTGAGGLYVTHMRDEADDVLVSIEETLRIGRAVNVPVVISHHKCSMPENFGRSVELDACWTTSPGTGTWVRGMRPNASFRPAASFSRGMSRTCNVSCTSAGDDRQRLPSARRVSTPAPVGTFPRILGHYARRASPPMADVQR
jgi:N-acyl-D-aspartate/D-glutamate deacylase